MVVSKLNFIFLFLIIYFINANDILNLFGIRDNNNHIIQQECNQPCQNAGVCNTTTGECICEPRFKTMPPEILNCTKPCMNYFFFINKCL